MPGLVAVGVLPLRPGLFADALHGGVLPRQDLGETPERGHGVGQEPVRELGAGLLGVPLHQRPQLVGRLRPDGSQLDQLRVDPAVVEVEVRVPVRLGMLGERAWRITDHPDQAWVRASRE